MDKQMMTEIIEQEGNESTFYVKEYKCDTRRHPDFLFWCGYITRTDGEPMTEQEIEVFDDMAIGGMTFNTDSTIGFDCGHNGQLIPGYLLNPMLDGESMVSPMDFYVTLQEVEDCLTACTKAMSNIENNEEDEL